MQESTETAGQLVVASCDTTELFEAIEETFDQVARLVAMPIDGALIDSVASRRDIGKGRAGFDGFDQFIAVVAFVGRNGGGWNIGDQCRSLSHIRHLSTGQDQTQGITQGINAGMDFRRQSTARSADRLIATVFFSAPAACWCARTIVASMNNSSKSASSLSTSATRAHTPPFSQLAKRTYIECQLPKSAGRSRHGHPVRAMKSTASTKHRLSAARPPLSVGFPGNKSAIRNHCLSFNIRRLMSNIQIAGCKPKSATVNRL